MDNLLNFFYTHPWLFLTWIAVIGICVGSFLNVVIYRLPLILDREWKQECRQILQSPEENSLPKNFNLATPRSYCPQCKRQINTVRRAVAVSIKGYRGEIRIWQCAHLPLRKR